MNNTTPKHYFERFHEHITEVNNLEIAYQRTEAELGPRYRTYGSFRSSKCQYLSRQRRMRSALGQRKKNANRL